MSKFGAELKAKLDEAMAGSGKNIENTATLKANDSDVIAKTDLAEAKVDEFGRKDETAHLRADNSDFDKKMEDTGLKEARLQEKTDSLHEHLTALTDLGGGGGPAGMFSSLGSSMGGADAAGGPLIGVILALGSALVPIAGVATGATLAIGGMGAALGASLGAFGLAAMPMFSQVSKGLTQITSDQTAVNRAVTASSKNTAILKLQQDIKSLNPDTATMIMQFDQAKASFMSWDNQFHPEIMGVFTKALTLVNPLLSAMTPLVVGGGNAMNVFLDGLKHGVESGGFHQFTQWAGKEAPGAMSSLQQFSGGVFAGLGHMFEGLTPFMHDIEKGLAHLGQSFDKFSTSKTFKDFIAYVIKEGPSVGKFFERLVELVGRLLVAFAPVGMVMLNVVSSFLGFMNHLLKAVPIVGIFSTVIATLAGVFMLIAPVWQWVGGVLGILISVVGELTVVFSPLGIVIVAVIGAIVAAVLYLKSHWGAVWNEVKKVAEEVWKFLENNVIHPMVNIFNNYVVPAVMFMGMIFQATWRVIQVAVQVAWDIIKVIFYIIEAFLVVTLVPAILLLSYAFTQAWQVIAQIVQWAMNVIRPLFNWLVTNGIQIVEQAIQWLSSIWQQAWQIIKQAVQWFWDFAGPIFGFIVNNGIQIVLQAVQWLSTAWDAFWSTASSVVSQLWDDIKPVINFIIGAIDDLIGAFNRLTFGIISIPSIPKIGDPPGTGAQGSAAVGSTSSGVKVHASGGTMAAGEPGIVGDAGPEVWIPDVSGRIIPNDQISSFFGNSGNSGGGSGSSINASFAPTIIIQGSDLTQAEVQQAVNNAMDRSHTQLAQLIQAHS
jgi:hypothetical protein